MLDAKLKEQTKIDTTGKLLGKKVALLATNGFEEDELKLPKNALEEAGAEVDILSIEAGMIKGWKEKDWSDTIAVDKTIADSEADDYDAMLLPGGVINADTLRKDQKAIAFAKKIVEAGKPIAAICHGGWLLIEVDAVRDRLVTSWPSLRTDFINAGAQWVDEEVATDEGLVTSRMPRDIPAFNHKMIEEFAEGKHAEKNQSEHKTVA